MGKYNGSGILLYADGVEIAAQKGFTLNANVNLFDITTSQSAGWAEHEKGVRSSDVSFEALQSTTGLSDTELFNYIKNRKSLMLVVTGLAYLKIGEVNCSSMTISAPSENAVGLSGNFKVNGRLYSLSPANANLITDPDSGGTDYDTLTVSGTSITSAINAAGAASVTSNAFLKEVNDVFKCFFYLTKTSGQLPSVVIITDGGADASNIVTAIEGLNVITFTIIETWSGRLQFRNSAAANWHTSPIYLLKK